MDMDRKHIKIWIENLRESLFQNKFNLLIYQTKSNTCLFQKLYTKYQTYYSWHVEQVVNLVAYHDNKGKGAQVQSATSEHFGEFISPPIEYQYIVASMCNKLPHLVRARTCQIKIKAQVILLLSHLHFQIHIRYIGNFHIATNILFFSPKFIFS